MFPLVLLVAAFTLSFSTTKAQTSDVTCSSGYDWARNSGWQTPCMVAAILEAVAACNPRGYTIHPLSPGNRYSGPTADPSTQNACICSTVMYELVSACGACQGASWIGWDAWSANCPSNLITISYYSQYIPDNTAIPAWAFYNPRFSGGSYDPVVARQIAGKFIYLLIVGLRPTWEVELISSNLDMQIILGRSGMSARHWSRT
ncbi:hypothetical protein BS47DRAFT_288539 [Hydnum rufescens UP504]|uniref:Uncharacterized protein n=1 Tax=Hydnum rufescens UP504 TaxID=1448309 RepID=A0A9P6AKW2_9AGAM|nr:hypothetical protein BS47DRAFT_288539 [Hydnum rufescens UP504]